MASENTHTAPTLRLRPREMTYKHIFVRRLAVIVGLGLVLAAIVPSSQHRFVSITAACIITMVVGIGCYVLLYLFLTRARIDITPSSIVRTSLWGKQHKYLASRIETSIYLPKLIEAKVFTGPALYLLDINGKRILKLQQDKWMSASVQDLATRVPAAKYETIREGVNTYGQLHERYRHYPGLAKYFEIRPVYGQVLIGLSIAVFSIVLAYGI
ncbi:MAG: hypothetical protein L0H36_02500 [bacterium]|nr:hypothetical protein [bacterium]MDN5835484.1 hypothetical protein [bacterium]